MVEHFDSAAFSQAIRARRAQMQAQAPAWSRFARAPTRPQREAYYATLRPLVLQLVRLVDEELMPEVDAIVEEAGSVQDADRLDNWSETLTKVLHRIVRRQAPAPEDFDQRLAEPEEV